MFKPDKIVAGLLAIFLGALGIHKFYLRRPIQGILYIIISVGGCFFIFPPFIIGLIAFIEGIVYLCTNESRFQLLYGKEED